MSKKLWVFDWNGTILSDTVPSWQAGNKCLEFYGAAPISLKTHRDTFCFPILPFYERHGVSAEEVLARRDEGNEVFQSNYEKLSQNCRTRAGARALLDKIKGQNHHCIILSNFVTEKINAQLARLNIAHYFDYVSAHDCDGTTILQSTTKALRLRDYMQETRFKRHQTVIIGDTMEEPEIARALGLTSIGITDGYISTPRLKAANPDYLVTRLDTIKTLGLI